jgi:hypothetical protein
MRPKLVLLVVVYSYQTRSGAFLHLPAGLSGLRTWLHKINHKLGIVDKAGARGE